MQRNRFLRTVGVMALLLIMAASMYAFTASNTMDDSNAGFGDGAVDGFDITGITYNFDPADGATIASVDFYVSPDANSVMARGNTDGTWVDCTVDAIDAGAWSCPIDTDTLELEALEIAAAD